MLPDPVLALLDVALPGRPVADLTATFGGFSNLTVACTVGGAPCVVKAASLPAKRADVRREALVLERLAGAGLPAPELLALAEGGGWTVAVTRRVAGAPGLRLYDRPPEELPPVYAALGRVLARVHALGPERLAGGARLPEALDITRRAQATRDALGGLPLEPELRGALQVALDHPAWRAGAPRLVHGDAGLHNILWDGGVTGLLDWEWAGVGSPLLDLAWVAWTIRFRQVPAPAWQRFLAGYGARSAPDESALEALALGQVAGILARSHGRAGAWDEWLRRARWTAAGAE